jgi:hypothetical protein
MPTAPPKKIVVKSKLSLFKEFVFFFIILEMLCLYIYKTYISHFLLVQIIIFPHEHPPSSDVHLKELAARAPQTAAAGLGLGERQMFPQHLQGSRSKGASWKSYPICSMCGIFIYIWVIFRANGGKYSIHGAYGYSTITITGWWYTYPAEKYGSQLG